MRRLHVNWQSPYFQEVKMDAEIGSYQVDDAPPFALLKARPRVRCRTDADMGSAKSVIARRSMADRR
jgi:hypothetical protein